MVNTYTPSTTTIITELHKAQALKESDIVARLNNITDDTLINALPHGSGIDSDWSIERLNNGHIKAHNSYHGMNDGGYYDGWQDFYVKIGAHRQTTFNELGPIDRPDYQRPASAQVMRVRGQFFMDVHLTGYRQSKAWAYELSDYLYETIEYSLFGISPDAPLKNPVSMPVIPLADVPTFCKPHKR